MADLFRNGFLLLIPVFVINIVLYKKLPEFFKPAQWDSIPKYVPIAENIFRYLSFLLPMIMIIGISSLRQKLGFVVYLIGLLIYFSSWLLQIKFKEDKYNRSLILRSAPAYTPIIWLIGIGLMCEKTYLASVNLSPAYFFIVVIFTFIHTWHAYLVVRESSRESEQLTEQESL